MNSFLRIFFGSSNEAEQTNVHRAAAQLDALHTLSRSLDSAFRRPEQVHRLVSSSAQMLLGSQSAVLVMYEPLTETLRVASVSGVQEMASLHAVEQRADQGVLGQAILTTDTIIRDAEVPFEHEDPILESLDHRNMLITPLRIDKQEFGVLAIDSRLDGTRYDENDVRLAEVFASFVAVVEQGVQIINNLNRKTERLKAVFEISRHLAQFTKLEDLLELVVLRAVSLTEATSGSVVLWDEHSGSLKIMAQVGLSQERSQLELHSGEGITGWVFQHGTGLLVDDVTLDRRYVPVRDDVQSELAVPLRTSNQVVGVLNVDHLRRNAFTSADLELLQALADVSSGAIQMAAARAASGGESSKF